MRRMSVILCMMMMTAAGIGCSTGIHSAAASGDVAKVQKLVSVKPDRVNNRDRWGFTPLHEAARHHQVEVVRVLLEHGADVHAVDSKSAQTPLDVARLGASRCNEQWLKDAEARTVRSADIGVMRQLYDPKYKPEWNATVQLLEKAYRTELASDGRRYPVIVRVMSQRKGVGDMSIAYPEQVTIVAGPAGQLYTVRDASGRAYVRCATLDQLQAELPETARQVKDAVALQAEASRVMDASGLVDRPVLSGSEVYDPSKFNLDPPVPSTPVGSFNRKEE